MKIIIICVCILVPSLSNCKTVNIIIPNLPTLNNHQFNIMIPKDHFKLITFWASWCLYCRKEFPSLAKLSKNISVYGIDYQEDIFHAKRFLSLNGNPYTKVLFDRRGILGHSLGVKSLPTSLLLENNKEIASYTGPINLETVRLILQYVNSKKSK